MSELFVRPTRTKTKTHDVLTGKDILLNWATCPYCDYNNNVWSDGASRKVCDHYYGHDTNTITFKDGD